MWWLLAACGSPRPSAVADPGVDPFALGACDPAAHPPRQVRLLTRREYDRTVADLLPGSAGAAACDEDADCAVDAESCVGGTCAPDPCELVTFVIPGTSAATAHVAGAFNGWPATPDAGGWTGTYTPSVGGFVVKQVVPDGTWPYKFVVDGVWSTDPANPVTADDGYGNANSVLLQACAGAPLAESSSPSSAFPVESRPEHYPFDNAAATGLVTTVHAEQYGRAAESIAERAIADLPGLVGGDPNDDAAVARWVTTFGRRVFRRPLTADETDRYLALIDAQDDRATGISAAVQAFLQSPFFLYRMEIGTPSGGAFALDDHEIAAELSYFLWGTTPDETLLDAAETSGLTDPDAREAEARRMLADPRAREQLGVFAVQWLGVGEVPIAVRSSALYPEWDSDLGESMVRETAAFVTWVAFDQRGAFRDLLVSDTMLVDDRLAALYGVPAPVGFGPVAAPPGRRGLLGQAAVLAATSHSDQTSPVKRGLLVRDRLLCNVFGPPPAAAGGVPEVDPDATTRERYEQHSSDPACSVCHTLIDPVGFGLEGFDPIGAARATENGLPIDTSGAVSALEEPSDPPIPFDGETELSAILADSDAARRCYATQVWRFATGGLDRDAQSCALDQLDAAFEATGGDLVELLVAMVRSDNFAWRSE